MQCAGTPSSVLRHGLLSRVVEGKLLTGTAPEARVIHRI